MNLRLPLLPTHEGGRCEELPVPQRHLLHLLFGCGGLLLVLDWLFHFFGLLAVVAGNVGCEFLDYVFLLHTHLASGGQWVLNQRLALELEASVVAISIRILDSFIEGEDALHRIFPLDVLALGRVFAFLLLSLD